MYEFILWMCLAQNPTCPIYNSVEHKVYVMPVKTLADCEAEWQQSQGVPDPEGMKSVHKCQPVSEDL